MLALPDPRAACWLRKSFTPSGQVGGVKGVMIKVKQQPYRVPGSDPTSLTIPVDAIPATSTLFRSLPGISCTQSATAVSIW